jgi:A/G-specific adenine glycosylase
MLQQTQVKTVIPYFRRFVARFPTLHELAHATETQVLHLWAGLGYYQRARNLHKCARFLVHQCDGKFPRDVDALQSLPGIGRSTASAIAAACFEIPAPILDGNVRRVLCRLYAVTELPGTRLEKLLWKLSEYHTPLQKTAQYNQAMMDLGAGVCTQRSPKCDVCPLHGHCRARLADKAEDYPIKNKRAPIPNRAVFVLLIENKNGAVLLRKRPARGVWPHLWSLPEISDKSRIRDHLDTLNLPSDSTICVQELEHVLHKFTHYALKLKPLHVHLDISGVATQVNEGDTQLWYEHTAPAAVALPAPIKKILYRLVELKHDS